ncbi:Crp/Fnr family transcriptional regulator [bacterium]|nr:MAG: Crp/Fnr family transcriptional regulator [bacterium]TNF01228.1 MAG: Crp/Fnr family transcriptional regulator [Bacteroidota bacterium]
MCVFEGSRFVKFEYLKYMAKKQIKLDIPSCSLCENRDGILCSLPMKCKETISEGKGGNFYRKGQIIFYEDNHVNGLYCIYKGKVKLTKLGENGKEHIVRFAKTGDVLGYRSLLGNETYKATAMALEDSYVCLMDKNKFKDVIVENPKLSFSLMELLSKDLKNAEQKLINISEKTVLVRMVEAILLLEDCFGVDIEGYIDVNLTRSEYADIVGTTIETAIRSLSSLKEDGYIDMDGKKIIITDKKGLLQISNAFVS